MQLLIKGIIESVKTEEIKSAQLNIETIRQCCPIGDGPRGGRLVMIAYN